MKIKLGMSSQHILHCHWAQQTIYYGVIVRNWLGCQTLVTGESKSKMTDRCAVWHINRPIHIQQSWSQYQILMGPEENGAGSSKGTAQHSVHTVTQTLKTQTGSTDIASSSLWLQCKQNVQVTDKTCVTIPLDFSTELNVSCYK